jgi:hypothetical protein
VIYGDSIVFVDTTAARTIYLIEGGFGGEVITIKDKTGTAAANNITVTTLSGTLNINGAATFVMNTNYQSASFVWDGTQYFTIYS